MSVPIRQSGAVTAAGTLVLTFPITGNRVLDVSQVSVEMATGAGTATGALRYNGALIAPFVPSGDAISDSPAITVNPGDLLTAEWTGATPGSIGTALFIYDPAG